MEQKLSLTNSKRTKVLMEKYASAAQFKEDGHSPMAIIGRRIQ